MKLSRRHFLGILLGGAAVSATSGCSQIIDRLAQPDLPDVLKPPGGDQRNPTAHLLNRAAYGPRPGQIAEVEKIGRAKWIERQLAYRDIDDDALEWRLRRYDTLNLNATDLLSFQSLEDSQYVADELARATLVRAVFSERQLYEVMVGFWSDHFSIYHLKDREVRVLKTVDDHDVIRAHALGKFKDLLRASAHSPAMLQYLDNTVNEKSHPNENYAREIMELHTLGVNGGYTEQDIQEVARCFTGWTKDNRGRFTFRSDWHDGGPKTVLGESISSENGKDDGEKVLEILAKHHSTARFICTKLVRRFVADDPPENFVTACIDTWQSTDGDIKAVLRTILNHPEFDQAPPKLKRPYEFLVSLMRATHANYDGNIAAIERLESMGNRPFYWVFPDGYPDYETVWLSNLWRYWNLVKDAVDENINGISIDLWDIAEHVDVEEKPDKMFTFFGRLFLSRDLTETDAQAIRQYVFENKNLNLDRDSDRERMMEALTLMLRSVSFLYR